MISKIKALTTDKEKNLQAPVEMEELSDGEAINVVGGRSDYFYYGSIGKFRFPIFLVRTGGGSLSLLREGSNK
ncbi:hypothetical protein NIES4072_20870 [Nostoc commune NIES-4072]|uniref:Uncharacterized protein n=1 Tax=Nostoc commune NIES-4072 TaxID=2005467 RepID=A0A2R5FI81_NOSCO|nr:hypothetical protein NIES4070_05930 [Nostoc commune HK-02]GBG18422.1 hypothetical protein NIES4072_20870 [Nostoc commune NIES-4072]